MNFFSRPVFLLFAILISRELIAKESVETNLPASPTNFSSETQFSDTEDTTDSLKQSPSLHVFDSGGEGKFHSISIRGSNSNDVAVTLEGIRLNPISTGGTFDFGMLSPFGLGDAQIIRGGYSPYSSSPDGEIALRLPKKSPYRSTLGVGSFESFLIGQETPFATLSIEQTQNDFHYKDSSGQEKTREQNFSQRINFRAWKRTQHSQVWTQVLYADEELPGGLSYPTPGAYSDTVSPTLAYQGTAAGLDWSFWGTYQNQSYHDPNAPANSAINRYGTLGQRGIYRFSPSDRITLEVSLESTQDKLYSHQESAAPSDFKIRSPLRETFSFSFAAFLTPFNAFLIHPRIRFEYVSDLKDENLSPHPGIGIKWNATSWLDVLGNLSLISRAPTFNEMYFQAGNTQLANPRLKRQNSFQGDIGYEARTEDWPWKIAASQAFFAERTYDLLQVQSLGSGITQVQNVGTSATFGLENTIRVESPKYFVLKGNYTLQRASLHDQQRIYQPTHLLNIEPQIVASIVVIGVPLYSRSSVKTSSGSHLSDQWDLGLKVETQAPSRWKFIFQAFNLLGWDRKEVEDYPMSIDPWFKLSASYTF